MIERPAFEKWYLDAVEPDGAATIAYWASLSWLGANVTWHNSSRYAPGEPVDEASSVRHVPPPVVVDRRVTWQSDRIGFACTHDARTPAGTLILADDEHGRITWECVAPSARVRLQRDGHVTQGAGYAERLTMTRAPWALPLETLRWGRWMRDDASAALVWIDWQGPAPRRWVLADGVMQADATLRDDGVDTTAGVLTFGASRVLHERSVGQLLRGIAGLARVAEHVPLSWRETKWCARGTWTNAAGVVTDGWAIHELVRFT